MQWQWDKAVKPHDDTFGSGDQKGWKVKTYESRTSLLKDELDFQKQNILTGFGIEDVRCKVADVKSKVYKLGD